MFGEFQNFGLKVTRNKEIYESEKTCDLLINIGHGKRFCMAPINKLK